jgi:hypothetical protein
MTIPEEINGIDDVRPGDIGFGPIHGKAGVAIRAALAIVDGGAPYQHVFMITKNYGKGLVQAVEAMPGGARSIIFSTDRWTSEYCYVRPNYEAQTLAGGWAAAQEALSLVGTPYSDLDYYAIGAHHLHLPSHLVDNYIKSSKHMICSQLVDYCLCKAGWHTFDDGRLSQDVTPSALYNKLDRWNPRLVFAYPK